MRLVGLSWFRGLPPACAAVTASAPLGIGLVAHHDPVDHEQRLGAGVDGRHAAQVDLDAAARRAGVLTG